MNNIDITSMLIVSTAVSLIISFVKHFAGASGTKANAIAIGVALVAAIIYSFLKDTVYWQTFLEVVGFANVIYTVLVQHVDTQIKSITNSSPLPPQV